MANCKATVILGSTPICGKCIKADVCEIAKEFEKHLVTGMFIESCEHFKDRSKFVELPCEVGDTVYYFLDTTFKRYEVVQVLGFHIDKYRTAFEISICGIKMFVDIEFLGEKIFLTKEEAEKALEEREK